MTEDWKIKKQSFFGGSKPPALLCVLIIGFRENAQGRSDWDDVGIVPYDAAFHGQPQGLSLRIFAEKTYIMGTGKARH